MGNIVQKYEDYSDSGLIMIQGFQARNLILRNLEIVPSDYQSRQGMHPIIRSFYPKTKAVIYTIDSTREFSLMIAEFELRDLMQEELLENCVLVIMANKQDMAGAMSVTTLKHKLGLDQVKQKCGVFACSALTGDGIYEAMKWLIQQLKSQKSDLDSGEETAAPSKGLRHKIGKMLSTGIKPMKQLVKN